METASSRQLSRDLRIQQKSAWQLAHRLREAWETDALPRFRSPVEADKTYIGGLGKNKQHLGVNWRADKTPALGLGDRASGRVAVQVIPRPPPASSAKPICSSA